MGPEALPRTRCHALEFFLDYYRDVTPWITRCCIPVCAKSLDQLHAAGIPMGRADE
jgi:hypothetical protein